MTPPAFQELVAPAGWAALDFISDLHLQAGDAATFDAWRRYMAQTRADAVFILGDLFEAWVGDDVVREPGFEADCLAVLREASSRLRVYLMRGNRDFLIGTELARAAGGELLEDPAVLVFAERRWLLTHGDALCLADTEYQAFRAQVRDPGWCARFLARTLEDRRTIARGLREHSVARSRSMARYADVDEAAAISWLSAADADAMIHGHTHRPADHSLRDGFRRIVLSDWDAAAKRMEVLRLSAAGLQRIRWS
jgi:UDP-2,3-diacylglucosamine hydrolase